MQYSAEFSNGHISTRTSKNEYSHAWAVIRNKDKVTIQTGFLSSEELARKAASSEIGHMVRNPVEEVKRAKFSGQVIRLKKMIQDMGGEAAVLAHVEQRRSGYAQEIVRVVRS